MRFQIHLRLSLSMKQLLWISFKSVWSIWNWKKKSQSSENVIFTNLSWSTLIPYVCIFVYLLTLDYLTADHPQLAHTHTQTVCFAGHNEKRLLHHLLDSYNTLERPVVNESDPLQISFGLTLMQIIDVDEKNQMLVTNIWLKLVSNKVYCVGVKDGNLLQSSNTNWYLQMFFY